MSLLIISVLALVLGPILYRVADSARTTLLTLDGFVMIAICGLVLVHIIPHAAAIAGPLALLLAVLGFLGPTLVEHHLRNAAQHAHIATLVFACLGLVAHAFIDGVALGVPTLEHEGSHEHGSILAIAIILHRLPVAITIWWLLKPSSGTFTAAVVLLGIGVATVLGFQLSEVAGAYLNARWVGFVQALVAGSLLHVVIHRPSPLSMPAPSAVGTSNIFAGIGALAGLVLVGVLADTHIPLHPEAGAINFRETFMALTLESAPALLLAFALAGLVQVYLPQMSLRWMHTGRALSESVRGVAFGLPLPICSCGVIPLYRSLITKGVPATAGMAFLVATPELGLDAVLISLPLLGAELAVARVVAAAFVALLVGVIVGKMAERSRVGSSDVNESSAQVRGSFWKRVRLGLRFGFGEIVDHIGPWLLLGLVIASLIEPMISGDWLAALPWGVEVLVFAILGMPMYVCASGATPLVAVLIHKGVSPGAALAFLLAGPATNITTFGVLAQLHGRRIAFAFAVAIAGLAIGIGLGVNVFMADVEGIALHESVHQHPELLPMLCLGVLVVVFALSLLRQGPRGFIGQVLSPHDDDDGCHDHDHGHAHDHDHTHDHTHGDDEEKGQSSCCHH